MQICFCLLLFFCASIALDTDRFHRTTSTNAGVKNVLDYGAKTDPTFDNHDAFQSLFDAIIESGGRGYIPTGTYHIFQSLQWDLGKRSGVIIEGDGAGSSKIVFSTPKNQTGWLFTSDTHDAFYWTFRDLGISGQSTGSLVSFGRPDSGCQSAFNTFWLNGITINQNMKVKTANALELNGVYNSIISASVNGNYLGVSLKLTCAQFTTFTGSYSSGGVGIHITGSYTFANTFSSVDVEVVGNGVVIDASSHGGNNVFIAGTYIVQHCFVVDNADASIMNNNLFMVPNTGYQEHYGVGLPKYCGKLKSVRLVESKGVKAGTDRIVEDDAELAPHMRHVPESGHTFTHSLPSKLQVLVGGPTLDSITINGVTFSSSGGQFHLETGDTMSVQYRGEAPSWSCRLI
ncbi:hypothetical protein PROFUN_13358 [Planoprotostelium fungivorum]|uniref:Pectate lyase superfamily protein domain-containing protein n=1 Tax=Planoprotostelium fungivorum TaxID=1890364 RepID=A0A2P6N434_9EUKA|nr:hypothetical protein PROFUN_13358 [Planoprotostelium fungivorum]